MSARRSSSISGVGFPASIRCAIAAGDAADAKTKKIVTRAVVRGAGLVAADGDAPVKISQNRVTVELREVDGDWLVDDIHPS